VLTFTSLFPSSARPRHGIFVETRLHHLVQDCDVDARVVAPVPWFPFRSAMFGPYAAYATTPRHATRACGLRVTYPRYLMLPKVGVNFQPDSMARSACADIAALRRSGWEPEVIDAHYFYPDGVAAAIVCEELNLPLVITARGSDVNVLAHMPGHAKRVLWAADRAAAIIAVSSRLKDGLVGLGVSDSKISVLRNGVDLRIFWPVERVAARRGFQLAEGPLAICVGHLLPEKGYELAIQTLHHLEGFRLIFAGEGPKRPELDALARRLGVDNRIVHLPSMPQERLRDLYSAADVTLLTSTREGWPNVVLESMACGTPVVAVDVGAVTDMVTNPSVGRVVPSRDPAEFARAVLDTCNSPAPAGRLQAHAARFDWRSISQRQFEILSHACEGFIASAQAEPSPHPEEASRCA